MNCRVCKNRIFDTEIYTDWYHCHDCNKDYAMGCKVNPDERGRKPIEVMKRDIFREFNTHSGNKVSFKGYETYTDEVIED